MLNLLRDIDVSIRTKLKDIGLPVSRPSDEELIKALASKNWTVSGKTQVFYTNPEYTKILHDKPRDGSSGRGQALNHIEWFTIEDTKGGSFIRRLSVWAEALALFNSQNSISQTFMGSPLKNEFYGEIL